LGSFLARHESRHGQPSVIADVRLQNDKSVKITIFILTVLLLGSNAWWIYQSIDDGVSLTYTAVSIDDSTQALDQTLSVVPLLASGQTSQEELITHLQQQFGLDDGFEKDGLYRIGRIGLRFNDGRKLIDIQRAWQ
jgi:hypothetical protein